MLYNVYKHKNEKNFTGIRIFPVRYPYCKRGSLKGYDYRDTEKEVD